MHNLFYSNKNPSCLKNFSWASFSQQAYSSLKSWSKGYNSLMSLKLSNFALRGEIRTVHRQRCFPYLVYRKWHMERFPQTPSFMHVSYSTCVGPSNALTTRSQCESQIPWSKDNVATFPRPEPMHTIPCHKYGISGLPHLAFR